MPDQDYEEEAAAAAGMTDVTQRSATPTTQRAHSSTHRTPSQSHQPPADQNAPSPLTSPLLPSPMSLYQLGIAPLSPLRRQFSSPLSGHSLSPPPTSHEADIDEEEGDGHDDDGSGSEATDELTQDSKDVLVERLTDLVQRLSRGDTSVLQDANISALHAKVDEMETVLAAGGRPMTAKRRSREARSRPTSGIYGGGDGAVDEQDPFGIMSPSWVMSHFYGADSTHTSVLGGGERDREAAATGDDGTAVAASAAARPEPGPRKISADVAERIVQEAEKLCAEMSEVVKSLQDRREEEERAAERILELEGRVEELEDEVQEAESDLRYLRLQLKAIEVQCLEYIPPDADPELVQSIQNWKTDWANLKRKWASRRSTSFEGEIGSPSTPRTRS